MFKPQYTTVSIKPLQVECLFTSLPSFSMQSVSHSTLYHICRGHLRWVSPMVWDFCKGFFFFFFLTGQSEHSGIPPSSCYAAAVVKFHRPTDKFCPRRHSRGFNWLSLYSNHDRWWLLNLYDADLPAPADAQSASPLSTPVVSKYIID